MIEPARDEERRLDLCEEAEHLEAMEDRAGEVPPPGPRERPIIFSGPMVRAILDGRKTQTRRVVAEQPGWDPQTLPLRVVAEHPDLPRTQAFFGDSLGVGCPYGKRGDRLWVRETWALESLGAEGERVVWQADRGARWRSQTEIFWLESAYQPDLGSDLGRWRPSIHMPRWASRLVRTVVSIRVERLQDISEADARAEGVDAKFIMSLEDFASGQPTPPSTYRQGFAIAWDEINGKRAPWESNPWVWVVTFAPIEAGS